VLTYRAGSSTGSITQATVEEIKKLGVAEKILIVEEIWDSILEAGEIPELSAEQAGELNRRIDSYHANPEAGRTWEEIKAAFWNAK